MTLEELKREGLIAGLRPDELEEMTWGEVLSVVEAARERRRRRNQDLSLIAYRQVALLSRMLSGGQVPDVEEMFPFWNEEELREKKIEKIRRVMEHYAAAGSGVKERA